MLLRLQRSGDEAGALQAANGPQRKGLMNPDPPPEETWARWDTGRQDCAGIQIHNGMRC